MLERRADASKREEDRRLISIENKRIRDQKKAEQIEQQRLVRNEAQRQREVVTRERQERLQQQIRLHQEWLRRKEVTDGAAAVAAAVAAAAAEATPRKGMAPK